MQQSSPGETKGRRYSSNQFAAVTGSDRISHLVELAGDDHLDKAIKKINGFGKLVRGWNGYDAVPPSTIACVSALAFLEILHAGSIETTRVAPSVVGGVGVTMKHADRKVYVEFYNDGGVYAMFTAKGADPITEPVRPQQTDYTRLTTQIQSHLYA